MNLLNRCAICDSATNLNTKMTVTIDSIEYNVAICSDHEDSSPKKIKAAISKQIDEISKAREVAQKYGLILIEPTKVAAITPAAPAPAAPAPAAQIQPHKLPSGLRAQKVGSRNQITAKTAVAEPEPIILPSSDAPSDAEKHDNYNLPKATLRETVKDQQKLTTPSRGSIILPKKIIDNEGGQTDIKIVNSGGDLALQTRFKQLAETSKSKPPDLIRGGYLVHNCNSCGGTGKLKGSACIACGGEGIVP